nr:isochorismatase family protein [Streptomyces chartreusis]
MKPGPWRPALLVIDPQKSFEALPAWESRNNPQFEENVLTLVDHFKSQGFPIYYFLDGDFDVQSVFHPASPHYKFMDFVPVGDEDVVIHKMSRNCFTSTDLDLRLRTESVDEIVVTGIKTEQCCETTARVGSDLGYSVSFVTEATMTFDVPDYRNPERIFKAADIVEKTELLLANRFAKIVTVSELLVE